MITFFITIIVIALLGAFVGRRLVRSNIDPVTLENAEKRLGARAALQFAIDNGLPLKTADGETDGWNAWNVRCASGLRVPGDLYGGTQTVHYIQPREGKTI